MTLLLVCQAHNGVVPGSSPGGPPVNIINDRKKIFKNF